VWSLEGPTGCVQQSEEPRQEASTDHDPGLHDD